MTSKFPPGIRNLIFLLFLLIFYFLQPVAAQEKYTVSGYIKDKETGENLLGATVLVKELGTGVAADNNGYYILNLPAGSYTLRISFISYEPLEQKLLLNENKKINFSLGTSAKELKEVVVSGTANSQRRDLEKTQMGKVEISMQQIKKLPAIFGEVDIMKTLQLLPGVSSGSEGSTGFYVRGGGPDQNLILLDDATVYNASHLFGFFSVFNSDAVKSVELFKGGYPARYGGRLSSVVDVNLKDGNTKKFGGTGGIGLIASRLTLEGPIIKNKSSFVVSGRRTYFDVFTRAYNKSKESDPEYTPIPDYFFYDLNGNANYQLDSSNRLYLSGYFGRDAFGFSRNAINFNFNWGNATSSARWNHIFTDKLFLNSTATFTDYNYVIKNKFDLFEFELGSSIQDWAIKEELDYKPNVAHSMKIGAEYIYHKFGIGRVQIGSTDKSVQFANDNKQFGNQVAAYALDEWEVTDKLKLDFGLRVSGFLTKDTSYFGLEPRASARYKLTEDVSLKGSYTRMYQYLHLVANTGASLPTDLWYPSNKAVKPQYADQVATGITFLLFDEKIIVTDEIYYKWLYNQIDFRDGAQLFFNPLLDEEFVFGKGWSYGNEIFIEKREGKATGWIGYTLAWTQRKFPEINNGEPFSPKYDTRHDVKIVLSYEISERVTISGTWVYTSGNYTTLPKGYAYFNDIGSVRTRITPIIDKRSNYQMASYHRMDLALVWKFKPKWGESDLSFSIYNFYNRLNPFFLYNELHIPDRNSPTLRLPTAPATAYQVSLFPVIPSVTYNFKF